MSKGSLAAISWGTIQKAVATVQTGAQSGLAQGSGHGYGEKGLCSGFMLRAQLTKFLMNWMLGARERQASKMTLGVSDK